MLKRIIEDNIVIATLENGKSNEITLETLNDIQQIVKDVNSDSALKGVILTGAGKMFTSGFSLPMFLNFKTKEEIVSFIGKADEVLLDFFTCKKPVVAAMNGHSVAAGIIFAMAADYKIVTNHPKIKLGMSEIKLGIPLSVAQSAVVRFGLDSDKTFRNVMYFGENVDVVKGKEIGFTDEIVEADQLITRAKKIITTWIDTPGRPFIQMKHLLKKDVANGIRQTLKEENWQDALECFFVKEVRQTIEFVQASMG